MYKMPWPFLIGIGNAIQLLEIVVLDSFAKNITFVYSMNNNDFALNIRIQVLIVIFSFFYVRSKYVSRLRANNGWIKIICILVHQSS